MGRLKNYINGIEGIGAGNTANGKITTNKRYHALWFFVGDDVFTTAEAIVDSIRIYVNSKLQVDLTAGEMRSIVALNGRTTGALVIPYFFSEPWRRSLTGEEATSWDLKGQQSCTFEVVFNAGCTNPTLKVEAQFDYGENITVGEDGKPRRFLSIVKRTPNSYNAGIGINDVTTLPDEYPIQRILVNAASGNITKAEVYKDDELIHDALSTENTEMLLSESEIVAGQFSYPIVFDSDQQSSSAIEVRDSLLVRVTNSAATTNRFIVERRAPAFV